MGNWGRLTEDRKGILLHYDASASDAGAVAWLTKDPRCKVSYNWLVLDDGRVVDVAPADARAWHAGVCRPSNPARLNYLDANSAFFGVAIAATAGERVTAKQLAAVVALCRALFVTHRWHPVTEAWRIVGHNTECWPRGRKTDPEGPNPARPVLAVADVRAAVAKAA